MVNAYAMFHIREAVSCLQMFFKIGALKIFCKYHRKTPVLEPFFNKVAGLKRSANLLKRDSTQVFLCEICKIFKNTFVYRTPLVAASEIKAFNFQCFLLWLCSFLFEKLYSLQMEIEKKAFASKMFQYLLC